MMASNMWKGGCENVPVGYQNIGTEKVQNTQSSENSIQKQFLNLTVKFHSDRRLHVTFLPRDVNQEEIRNMLCDFSVKSILILTERKNCSSALVNLSNPEILEEWNASMRFRLRGSYVKVKPTLPGGMIFVGRLPLTYTEEQFYSLVCQFGDVKKYFLMISEKTGKSKGYGFVKYVVYDCALFAKSKLNVLEIEGCTLQCDLLSPNLSTLKSLHSKCLYVDQLPNNIHDLKTVPIMKNAIFCQRGIQNGCVQNWGLVEFRNWEEAEEFQTIFNGYMLEGKKIRISFCIPGVHGIEYFFSSYKSNQLTKDVRASVLPDPSIQSVAKSFQGLFNHHVQKPEYNQKVIDIVFSELHSRPDHHSSVPLQESSNQIIPTVWSSVQEKVGGGKNNIGKTDSSHIKFVPQSSSPLSSFVTSNEDRNGNLQPHYPISRGFSLGTLASISPYAGSPLFYRSTTSKPTPAVHLQNSQLPLSLPPPYAPVLSGPLSYPSNRSTEAFHPTFQLPLSQNPSYAPTFSGPLLGVPESPQLNRSYEPHTFIPNTNHLSSSYQPPIKQGIFREGFANSFHRTGNRFVDCTLDPDSTKISEKRKSSFLNSNGYYGNFQSSELAIKKVRN